MSRAVDLHLSYDREGLPRISVTNEGRTKTLPMRISPMDVAFLVELAERCEKQKETCK